jgi:hypothetical protein
MASFLHLKVFHSTCVKASDFTVAPYKLLKLLQTPGLLCGEPKGLQDTFFTPEPHARNQTDGKLGRNDPQHSH